MDYKSSSGYPAAGLKRLQIHQEEIRAGRAVNMEELLDKYRMTKERRIEMLGKMAVGYSR